MYRISKEHYGFRLTFGHSITVDEMLHFRLESVRALVGIRKEFGLIIDIRDYNGEELDKEAREEMADGIELYRNAGVYRSCMVLNSGPLTGQYRRRQSESRTKFHERYINAEKNPMWSVKAINWVANGVEPTE